MQINKLNKNILIGLLVYSFIGLFIPSAHAQTQPSSQQVLSVSPIIINVPLSPGKILNKEITIQNMTDTPLPLRASLNDFQTTGEEGGYVFEDSKTNPLLSWVKISDTDLILGPKEKKTVLLTITTPKNIPLGGYYGMLFFETVPQTVISSEVTRVVPKIGVLMLGNVGVPDPNAKKAEILTYQTGFLQTANSLPLLLRVKNVSLHFFTAKPILTISPLFSFSSQTVNPIYLEEKIVFQGNIRRWTKSVTLPNEIPNIYKAHLIVSTGNGEFVTQDTYFVLLPSVKVTLVAFVVLFVVLLTLWRKKLFRAIKILLFNK